MYLRIRDLVYCEIVGEGKPIVMIHAMGVDPRTMKGCMRPVFQSRRDNWQRVYFDLASVLSSGGDRSARRAIAPADPPPPLGGAPTRIRVACLHSDTLVC